MWCLSLSLSWLVVALASFCIPYWDLCHRKTERRALELECALNWVSEIGSSFYQQVEEWMKGMNWHSVGTGKAASSSFQNHPDLFLFCFENLSLISV